MGGLFGNFGFGSGMGLGFGIIGSGSIFGFGFGSFFSFGGFGLGFSLLFMGIGFNVGLFGGLGIVELEKFLDLKLEVFLFLVVLKFEFMLFLDLKFLNELFEVWFIIELNWFGLKFMEFSDLVLFLVSVFGLKLLLVRELNEVEDFEI